MNKIGKTILSTISFLILLCFFIKIGHAESKYSRTLYDGLVNIEPISIPEIKNRLERHGCHPMGDTQHKCVYKETIYHKENAIEVYPYGPGFGPMSFYFTKDKYIAVKDIPGRPKLENYQKEVKRDLEAVGNIVKVKEGSWKIISAKYPWDVLY